MRVDRICASCVGPISLIATFSLPAPGARGFAREAGDLASRLRTEAPQAWSKLDDSESSIAVVGVMTTYIAPNTGRRFRYVRSGARRLYEFDQEKVSPGEVHCVTPERGFILVRKAADGPWAIKNLGKLDAKAEGVYKEYFGREFLPLEETATHGFYGTRLSQVMTMPEFRLKAVEPLRRDGLELARVMFEHQEPAVGQQPGQVVDIDVILRPEKLWSVQEVVSKWPDGTKATTRLEYGDDEGDLPTLKGLVLSTYFRDGRGTWGTFERADKFSSYSHKPAADSTFSLGAFGLPDPGRKLGTSTEWRAEWIFLGLAIGFGVLAVALWVRWSRPSRGRSSASP